MRAIFHPPQQMKREKMAAKVNDKATLRQENLVNCVGVTFLFNRKIEFM